MHGVRLPTIAGLIRFNDEVSEEAKRVVLPKFFLGPNTELVEVVSDDTAARSHEREHIESGAALWSKMKAGTTPVAFVFGAQSIGPTNQNKEYHANQARVAAQTFAEDWLIQNGGGLVVIAGNTSLSDPQMHAINSLVLVDSIVDDKKDGIWKFEEMKRNEKFAIFSPFIQFDHFDVSETADMRESKSFALTDGDILLGGMTEMKDYLTDVFVTTDCPEGMEKSVIKYMQKILKKPIIYSSNDLYLHKLLNGEKCITFSALPVGLPISVQKELSTKPWLSSSILDLFSNKY